MRESFVRIPVPVAVKTKAERDAMLAAAAQQDKEAGFAKLAEGALDWLSRPVASAGGLLRQPGQAANPLQNATGGWGESSAWRMPWAVPAGALALGGGLYGGWKLTDYLLDKTRSAEQESELEAARKDYENALAGRRKLAAAGAVSSPLDELADRYEKRALWNELAGPALLGTGALALGSGIGAYNWTRSLAEDKAVEEAVRQRQAQIAEQSPSPVMAIPMPMPVYKPRKSHWQRLLGRKPPEEKEKVANVGQAADQFLNRIKSNQMAVWQRLMTPTDAKPAKPVKPAEPAPPQLPTLAGTRANIMSR
jgi:hypothetical protein